MNGRAKKITILSVLAAAEMSVISQSEAEERLDKALSSVEALEKYKGNLYNWYDTSTLKKVKPFYVSSVDSGNFLCAVTALKEGLKENGGIDTSGSICRRTVAHGAGVIVDRRLFFLANVGHVLAQHVEITDAAYEILAH